MCTCMRKHVKHMKKPLKRCKGKKNSGGKIPVRINGGKSLRNGMWHGVRNGIIMRNTIYAENKLTEERILFSSQFYKSSTFFDVVDY